MNVIGGERSSPKSLLDKIGRNEHGLHLDLILREIPLADIVHLHQLQESEKEEQYDCGEKDETFIVQRNPLPTIMMLTMVSVMPMMDMMVDDDLSDWNLSD